MVEQCTHKAQKMVQFHLPAQKVENTLKLYNFMYNETSTSKLFLKRKKDVFEKYIKMRS